MATDPVPPTRDPAAPGDSQDQTPPAPRARAHLHLVPPLASAVRRPGSTRGPGPGQQSLALQFTLANGSPAEPALPRRLTLVEDDDFGPRLTARALLPPAGAWVARLSVAIVEVLLGQRPAGQLVRWTTHEVLTGLQERSRARLAHPSAAQGTTQASNVRALRTTGRQSRYTVRSMRLDEPADGIVEATVVLTGPARPIPLALRLEGLDGRWICTVVDSPDRSVTGTAPMPRSDP